MDNIKVEQYSAPADSSREAFEAALSFSLTRIHRNISTFGPGQYPAPASVDNIYQPVANTLWTSAFWTGMLWQAWEQSGDAVFRVAAESHLPDYRARLDGRISTQTHDLGFLYTLSCVTAWRLTGNRDARATALKAADLLMCRFFEKAGIIQAWGDLSNPVMQGRIIIDCAMNLPLLYWASEETGNPYYREAAEKHIRQANASLIRPDWSTFHTYYFDTETGLPLRGVTHQGYSDTSCWSRGQAWCIYGNAISFRYLRDPALLEAARGSAHYFLKHLPEDLVPYWDLVFVNGDEERDSSAAAIAACGLLELASLLPLVDPDKKVFESAALKMMESLSRTYLAHSLPDSNGILVHGVYGKPQGNGVDECVAWGDYYFVEALRRLLGSPASYW